MPFEVFDYRTDNRNILVTPEIRARLMRIAVNVISNAHSSWQDRPVAWRTMPWREG